MWAWRGLRPRDARLAAPRPQHAPVSCSPWVSRDQELPTAESPRPHLCGRPPPGLHTPARDRPLGGGGEPRTPGPGWGPGRDLGALPSMLLSAQEKVTSECSLPNAERFLGARPSLDRLKPYSPRQAKLFCSVLKKKIKKIEAPQVANSLINKPNTSVRQAWGCCPEHTDKTSALEMIPQSGDRGD